MADTLEAVSGNGIAKGKDHETPVAIPEVPPTRILTISAISGVVIAALCLVLTAAFLFFFLYKANMGITAVLHGGEKLTLMPPEREATLITGQNVVSFVEQKRRLMTYGVHAQMDTARIGLVACGVFAGVAFGFLGFSLFLLGIKGEIDLRAKNPTHEMEIKSLAPGAFVIMAATMLIAFCIFERPVANFGEDVGSPLPQTKDLTQARKTTPETQGGNANALLNAAGKAGTSSEAPTGQ